MIECWGRHPDTLTALNNLAFLLDSKGDYSGAEPLYRRALEGRERVLGRDHPDTLTSVSNLAGLLENKGDYAGAELLYRRALEGQERVLGKDHPDTLRSVGNLAGLLCSKGDYAGAEPLYRRALEGRERVLGKDHPSTLNSVNNLAFLLKSKGDYTGAEPLCRQALEGQERVLGKDHPDTLDSMKDLADMLEKTECFNEARLLRLRRIDALSAKSDTPPQTLRSLALDYFKLGEFVKAEELLNRLLESGFEASGTHHHLARICLMTDRFIEAQDHVAQAWNARAEAQLYVVARLLWLHLVTRLLCDPQSRTNDGNSKTILAQLKAILQNETVFMEWSMEPVLKHLEGKLDVDALQFLSALVAAMSDRKSLSSLDQFAVWRETKPQPLE